MVQTRGRKAQPSEGNKKGSNQKSQSPIGKTKGKASRAKSTSPSDEEVTANAAEAINPTDDVKSVTDNHTSADNDTAAVINEPPASTKKKKQTSKQKSSTPAKTSTSPSDPVATGTPVSSNASSAKPTASSVLSSSISTSKPPFHYEFGGPVGAFFVITSLPFVIYGLYFICNGDHCVVSVWDL